MTVGGSGNVLLHAKLSKKCPRRKKIQGGFFEFLSGSSMLFVRFSHCRNRKLTTTSCSVFSIECGN